MATTEERLTTLESQFAAFKTNSEAAGQSATTAANAAKDTADAAAEALNTIKGVTTDTFAKDVEVVHKTGDEDIYGVKTFLNAPAKLESTIKKGVLPSSGSYLYTNLINLTASTDIAGDDGRLAGIGGWIDSSGTNVISLAAYDFNGSNLYTNIRLYMPKDSADSANCRLPTANPQTTNKYTLGTSGYLWKDIYCASSAINTSDQAQKQNITDYPDALLDAWEDVDFQLFKFKDAVAKKGTDARIHAGLIAQAIKSAFEAHDIDPTQYGLFCYDSWDAEPEVKDQDGNIIQEAKAAGESYGLRYIECLCIEAAYQRRKAKRLEARMKAIEEKLGITG